MRYRTVGDMTCTGAVALDGDDARGGRRRDRRDTDHRARRDPRRRPRYRGGDGGSQARGVLLTCERTSAPPGPREPGRCHQRPRRHRDAHQRAAALRHRRLGRRRQVDADRAPAATTPKQILADQLEHVMETSERRGDGYLNLALLTDGLRAEREQGITIDVAYRYFQTARRKFIIADTPGPRAVHAQHGHRRVDRRPVDRAGRRAQGRERADAPPRRSSPRCCGSRTSSCASTRWTSSTTTRRSSTRSSRS